MSKKIYLREFQNNHHIYFDVLLSYRSEQGWFWDSQQSRVHTIPFLLTCAAALECCLNDHIIEYYGNKFDDDQAALLTSGTLSMTLKGKLLHIVPLLTSQKFMININHKSYQVLAELIRLRNSLVHNKSDFELHEAHVLENEEGNPCIKVSDDLSKRVDEVQSGNLDYSLGVKRNVTEFHDAIEYLREHFLEALEKEDFTGNDLIVPLRRIDLDSIVIT
jgi:hypothetical protein